MENKKFMVIGMVRKAGLSVIFSAALLVACGGEERQGEYLARAQEYYNQDNLDKAKIEAKNVLQINPNNAAGRKNTCRT